MSNSFGMSKYLKKNLIPVCIQVIFVASCILLPSEYIIYSNFAFYTALFAYFLYKKELHMKEWKSSLKSGRRFWIQTSITTLFFLGAFILTASLENVFEQFSTGMVQLKVNSFGQLILFVFSTVLFPAITEETFYRKNLIAVNNRNTVIVTTVISAILFGLEHALLPWGIFLTAIWAIPLSVSYIKTRNIYVSMTAHLVVSLIGNGFDIVAMIGKLL